MSRDPSDKIFVRLLRNRSVYVLLDLCSLFVEEGKYDSSAQSLTLFSLDVEFP